MHYSISVRKLKYALKPLLEMCILFSKIYFKYHNDSFCGSYPKMFVVYMKHFKKIITEGQWTLYVNHCKGPLILFLQTFENISGTDLTLWCRWRSVRPVQMSARLTNARHLFRPRLLTRCAWNYQHYGSRDQLY